MKKISALVLVLIIFNFIFSNYTVYATSMTMDEYKTLTEEGKTNIGGTKQELSLNESDVGAGTSGFGTFLTAITASCLKVVSNILCEGDLFYHTESAYSAKETRLVTVSSIIFDEFLLLNPVIYQKTTDFTGSGASTSGVASLIDGIKDKAASFSKFLVKIALVLTVIMLFFSIVKALLAKNAVDVAVWKKILARWVLCIFLIMFFQYILIFVDVVTNKAVEGLWNVRLSMEDNGYQNFESVALDKTLDQYEKTGGVTSLAYSLIFVVLFIVQMIFLVKYIARAFGLIVLFMLAPVIILMHSFNLMLGRESNTLGEFFKNYILLSLMQPFHALFYLILFFSFSELAGAVPILGIILLYGLLRAASIAKAMFGWELSSDMFSLKK